MPAIGIDPASGTLSLVAKAGPGAPAPGAARGLARSAPSQESLLPAAFAHPGPGSGSAPGGARLATGGAQVGGDIVRALEDALTVVLRMQVREHQAGTGSARPSVPSAGLPAAVSPGEAVAFQAVVEVRNRLMAAYHEIMNMPV
jgi:hypothetical protein